MVSKVIFIGDAQRGEQEGNILRLQALFSPVLKELDVPFFTHVSATNRLADTAAWLEGWKETLTADRDSTLEADVFRDAAVVGFEIAEKDLTWLNRHGVPWMNFTIHPLRFLNDLYLDVTTSFPYDFSRHAASRGLIDVCVQALRVRYGLEGTQDGPTTLTIFGQTPFDRSVYFDGGFRSLEDYLDTLDKLAAGYDRVLYKPHPHLTNPDVDALIASRYDAQPCRQKDVYELFVRGNINTACAISSSILEEAPYFGVGAEFLEPRAKRYGTPIGYRALLDDLALWETLLGRPSSIGQSLDISSAVPAGYVRQVYSSWGFVTDGELLKQKIEEEIVHTLSHDVEENQLETYASMLEKNSQALERCTQALEQSAQNLAQATELANQALAQAHQYSREFHDVSSQLSAMYASTSWRVTAPLRWMGRLFNKGGWKAAAKGGLRRGSRYINGRPRLRRLALGALNRMPTLKARLRQVLVGPSGVVEQDHHTHDSSSLTAHANRVHEELMTAYKNAKPGNR